MGDGGMISGGERKLTFACFPFALVQLLLLCCMKGRTKRNIHTHKYVHHIWSTAYEILLKLQYYVHYYRHPNVLFCKLFS